MSATTPPVRPRELVLLARDFNRLVDWYVATLGFGVVQRIEDLPYANLETEGGLRIGIGSAPPDIPSAECTIVPQLETTDVPALLQKIQAAGGRIDGPMRDPQHGFLFGSFQDPERNTWWVVDDRCP